MIPGAPERVVHPSAAATPPTAPPATPARWRPPAAVAAIVIGFAAGEGVAYGLIEGAGGDGAPDWVAGAGLVLADVVALAVVVAFARHGAERLTPATLGIRRTRFWPAAGWTLAIFVGALAAEALWTLLVGGRASHEPTGHRHDHGALVVAFLFLGVAVVAPTVEELAFRGYLFPALTRWRGPWIAAALTGLLFGAAHAGVYPLQLLPALAFFGFGACLLYWFTGSLLPCIAAHALNNSIVLSVDARLTWEAPLAIAGSLVVAMVLLWPLARERAPRPA